jgi:indolepyruvate ferredoxin oxidoreductase alpha subunit
LALGALRAGVKVVTGYPGTPSSRCIASLLAMNPPGRHIEWSTNEKVALEIAAGAAWAGQRSMCTMKMSGLNVAYDSLISIAYSGVVGGFVIYVADDPGVNAGMAEQDSRGFAVMADLPMLEPASPVEAYRLIQEAFELSEQVGAPVFIRLVTAVANSKTVVDVEDYGLPPQREAQLIRDINRFTKAGAAICMQQHRDLIARLERAGEWIGERGLNELNLSAGAGGLGIVASGAAIPYLDEGFELAARFGFDPSAVSLLKIRAVHPFPAAQARKLLEHCRTVLVLEELEPHIEKSLAVEAYRMNWQGRIIGKLDGTFSRIGSYDVRQVIEGINRALELSIPAEALQGYGAEQQAAARPITFCAGCPHRGTYMAINEALRKLRYRKDEVMVTGDIGCTILGMNPPFNTVWNEVSMGASIGLAQGYVHAGVKTPVIATIGDSTFFHAGMPGLVNAVQHQVPLTLIILDNGWTAMTGMQANPGTCAQFQGGDGRQVDIAQIVQAMGADHFYQMDPSDLPSSVAILREAIQQPGVKVVLSRMECAIQAHRRGANTHVAVVDMETCKLCKLCITLTGCPALSIDETELTIDPALCTGCNLCMAACNLDAIHMEPVK